MLVTYRPNRYAVQLVPALAILSAVGLSVTCRWLQERGMASGPDASAGRGGRARRRPPATAVSLALLTVAVAVSAVPGLIQYARWMSKATYRLPQIQSQFASSVPDGVTVAGYPASLLLMSSRAATITPSLEQSANPTDLYARGTRWYIQRDDAARPTDVPEEAWADRQTVTCAVWLGHTFCLYKVP
jgi:hypothetical protein